MNTLFRVKHGVNRAAHAAAQQLDDSKLAQGILSIDSVKAQSQANLYLQQNLRLSSDLTPLPDGFLRAPIDVLVLEVINENRIFPYHYVNAEYGYEVTLNRPGVIMIIRVEYPRIYRVMGPITWVVKGAAELYPA